jgi:probable HAF family extracellular repeat protein
MTDLGALGGFAGSEAWAINNLDQVVGFSCTAAGEGHAFLWDPATGMRDLGSLGGAGSAAYDINDAGQGVVL